MARLLSQSLRQHLSRAALPLCQCLFQVRRLPCLLHLLVQLVSLLSRPRSPKRPYPASSHLSPPVRRCPPQLRLRLSMEQLPVLRAVARAPASPNLQLRVPPLPKLNKVLNLLRHRPLWQLQVQHQPAQVVCLVSNGLRAVQVVPTAPSQHPNPLPCLLRKPAPQSRTQPALLHLLAQARAWPNPRVPRSHPQLQSQHQELHLHHRSLESPYSQYLDCTT